MILKKEDVGSRASQCGEEWVFNIWITVGRIGKKNGIKICVVHTRVEDWCSVAKTKTTQS